MAIKKVAKKGLAIFLVSVLMMGTDVPVTALGDELSEGITEVSVEEVPTQNEEQMLGDRAGLPADLNDIVTVENYVIDLNGASVVVVRAEGQSSTYCRIFPDYNGDRLPDNQTPLKIGENTYYKLNSYEIRGYSDPSKPFEGDISITLSAGIMKNVYGIYGTENAPVQVNGDVKLHLEGGNVSSGNAITSYYGKAENVVFSFTKTTNDNAKMYAAYESEIEGDVNFIFGGQAQVRGLTEAEEKHAIVGVVKSSIVGGDVNAKMEFDSADYGFIDYTAKENKYLPKYWTKFVGVSDSTIGGNIYYDLNSKWLPGSSVFLQSSKVGKNVDMQIVSGDFTAMEGNNDAAMIENSTIDGNLSFTSDQQIGLTSQGSVVLLRGTSAETKTTVKGDLYVEVPTKNIKNGWTGIGAHAVVEGAVYSNVAGDIAIDTVGSDVYTIENDVEGKTLAIYEDANVVIAEGVNVELSQDMDLRTGAKLINKGELSVKLVNRSEQTGTVAGVLENRGSLSTDCKSDNVRGRLNIEDTGVIINEKEGTWNVGCYVDNQGKIVNYGSFVQTYSYESGVDYYYAKLGEIYTTTPLTLSHQINVSMYTHIYDSTNKKYNSEMYYAIDVDYPAYCAAAPTLTGTEIVMSGISGDNNRYIRMARVGDGITSDFTLTPGEVKIKDCILESVTYGAEKKKIDPTKTAQGEEYTASVLGEFSPITITLDYGECAEITPITLGKKSDTVGGLKVEQNYTQASPLYDLNSLVIIGDIDSEEGTVSYAHKSGQLPKGIVFQNGKLYGTCKEASNTETVITFTVTGRNLTTAEFTLTLGAVAKAVPKWSVPSGFAGRVGQTVQDVVLPSDSRGEYVWATGEQALDRAGTVVTNIIFTPNNSYSTNNYDWATAAGDAWDAKLSRIYCPVQIEVSDSEPQMTIPTGLTAIYGQTFKEIVLPSDENGTYIWDTSHHEPDALVGNVGMHTCYVVYKPADENCSEKSGIAVTLTVNPATPKYKEVLSEIEGLCDTQLGEISLPETEDGSYQWGSETSIKPEDGETYTVIYLPDDIVNYDWSKVSGWNDEKKGVLFPVVIKIVHAWDEGKVVLEPTKEAEGKKVYTCGLCGEVKSEVLKKLPDVSAGGDDKTVPDSPGGDDIISDDGSDIGQGSAQPQVGYTLSDKKTKAIYKISVVGKEVAYVKPMKKTYSKVKIPNTIKYGGVTYRVTSIANNAFKNNKKLKSVTIPKNVAKIGSKAFYGCKKLTKLTIKTSKLTTKTVGKKAFTKMGSSNYKKVKVKVPKKKLKAYKKLLQKRGLSKKAKVKK